MFDSCPNIGASLQAHQLCISCLSTLLFGIEGSYNQPFHFTLQMTNEDSLQIIECNYLRAWLGNTINFINYIYIYINYTDLDWGKN